MASIEIVNGEGHHDDNRKCARTVALYCTRASVGPRKRHCSEGGPGDVRLLGTKDRTKGSEPLRGHHHWRVTARGVRVGSIYFDKVEKLDDYDEHRRPRGRLLGDGLEIRENSRGKQKSRNECWHEIPSRMRRRGEKSSATNTEIPPPAAHLCSSSAFALSTS